MLMFGVPEEKYTLEEYLELEKNSEERYEFFDGEVFAMSGGSPDHARLSGGVYALLDRELEDGDCEAFNSEMRIKVPTALPYRYPDVSVVCGEPVFEELDGLQMLVNPILIVEVLSPSTVAYDLGEKFTAYQSIETFREYLLVSQDRPHVIQHIKQARRRWLRIDIEGLDGEVTLESVGVTLSLRDIYRRVEFQDAENEP
jgi:Uma2 family endonuclease